MGDDDGAARFRSEAIANRMRAMDAMES